ncbi:hypothetical protein E4U57_000571 [Claviceps arundinis]|uniref:C2H2-type domain-containing protein n=2 Tax=Claviceps arundinis TaxID=1623583 RepID=A0ABQ7PCQ6_9HYPO|nr:hypothetical protein E4U57_000571 [Claviceps arundinis]
MPFLGISHSPTMFSPQNQPQEHAHLRQLTDDDQQQLLRLVQRYGVPSLCSAMTGSQASSGDFALPPSVLPSSLSAASLPWSGSDVSCCRSDDASVHTQYTWPEVPHDVQSMHDSEPGNMSERSWLDSPAAIQSPLPPPLGDITSYPSPRLTAPTSKKYQCPMCFLDNSPVGFGRKSDFKKHLHNFHGADVVWICRTKGCHSNFTTERAYSTHAKEAHRMKALPNSTARTDMCAQLVFSCGFATCKERLFEAQSAHDAPATREKHFEHIAKHFEDGFDVKQWEFRVQVQNLMRQPMVKSIWKTCIWPKEKRQQLYWRPRSSADLKRMLECRHLGNDISTLVRLAFILGTAPFTNPVTPPPAEIDMYFQLPYRSCCPINSPDHNIEPAVDGIKTEDDAPTLTTAKCRSSIATTVFRLSSRHVKRSSRSSTPAGAMGPTSAPSSAPTSAPTVVASCASASPPTPISTPSSTSQGDTTMSDDATSGPHPGTPFPIPNETVWPVDAPQFAPEMPQDLHKQAGSPFGEPLMYAMPMEQSSHQSYYSMGSFPSYPANQGTIPHGMYDYSTSASPASMSRPATPVPYKRPASWSRVVSMEGLRPSKKAAQEVVSTMLGM